MQNMAAAQQAAMMRAMMGHPGAAMHMAMMQQHMGMMPPQMWQQKGGHRPPMHPGMHPGMFGPYGASSRRARGAEGSSSSSGDDSSSSSESSDDAQRGRARGATGPPPMWPVPPAPPMGPPAPTNSLGPALEAFLGAVRDLDSEVANRLRGMPPHLQQEVMRRGPLDTRSPTSNLLSRMQQAIELDKAGIRQSGGAGGDNGIRPIKQSAKAAIEAMITEYRLSPGCAWMMRSLPPDKQKLAAKIDPSGQADPSAYIAEELQKIV